MKKISVFTGTRAEYGLMKNLIINLNKSKYFKLFLLVSSTHLNQKFGNTVDEIKEDNIPLDYLLPIEIKSSKKIDMANQTSETINIVSKALEKINPDFLIILGDRFETFAAATAAHILGIKIIHIHGGETTLGAIDNKLRNAITQLSAVHFTSAEIHKKKVIKMIGSKENIFNIGPIIIDGLLNLKNISKNQFQNMTGFKFSEKNFLITYHPETMAEDLGISCFESLLNIISEYNCNILFTSPNADAGSDLILQKIIDFVEKNKKNYFYVPSLGQQLYINALLLFDCIVGNSSSGITEAPLLNQRVVNIGERQKGRYRFGEVIDVSSDFKSLSNTFDEIFKLPKKEKFNYLNFKKKYINKSPTEQIIKFLKEY